MRCVLRWRGLGRSRWLAEHGLDVTPRLREMARLEQGCRQAYPREWGGGREADSKRGVVRCLGGLLGLETRPRASGVQPGERRTHRCGGCGGGVGSARRRACVDGQGVRLNQRVAVAGRSGTSGGCMRGGGGRQKRRGRRLGCPAGGGRRCSSPCAPCMRTQEPCKRTRYVWHAKTPR